HHLGVGEQLPAGDGEQHPEPQGGHLPLWPNASWQPTERLSFGADLYRSTASRPEGGQDTFVTAGLVNNSPVAEDILNFADLPHSLPSINVVVPPSQLGLSACPAGADSPTNPGYC